MEEMELGEKDGKEETLTDVIVLLKGCDTILVLVLIKVRLHICDLDACFICIQLGVVYCVTVLDHHHILSTKTIRVETLKGKYTRYTRI